MKPCWSGEGAAGELGITSLLRIGVDKALIWSFSKLFFPGIYHLVTAILSYQGTHRMLTT